MVIPRAYIGEVLELDRFFEVLKKVNSFNRGTHSGRNAGASSSPDEIPLICLFLAPDWIPISAGAWVSWVRTKPPPGKPGLLLLGRAPSCFGLLTLFSWVPSIRQSLPPLSPTAIPSSITGLGSLKCQ